MGNVHKPEEVLDSSGKIDLSSCDREPIHIPSAIQPHGMLLAARLVDLRIIYASVNAPQFLGRSAEELLACDLTEALGIEVVAEMRGAVGEGKALAPRRWPICQKDSSHVSFHAVVHCVDDMLCVELEPALTGQDWELTGGRMETAIDSLQRTQTQVELCATAAREIRCLTGYDQVMIYRFHEDDHGEVVAEEKDEGVQTHLHLHFPASDIPSQARALYLLQRTRMVANVAYQPVPLVGDSALTGGRPLDMTHCRLRSLSPVHIQYMKNMGVGASFAISLIHEERLWGLIICHHRTARLLAPEVRSLCDLLGRTISMLIGVTQRHEQAAEAMANRGRLDRLTALLVPGSQIADVLVENLEELLDPVAASGALVQLRGHTRLAGATPSLEDSRSIMNVLRGRLVEGCLACESLGETLPAFAHLATAASGVLMISIGDSPDDCVLWFRPERVRTISWGGNPEEAKRLDKITGQIAPRESFAVWRQTQRGHSQPWRGVEIAMALEFRHVLTVSLLRHADVRMHLGYYFDGLTKLANRRVLLDRLTDHHQESPQSAASLIFLDLDRFKMVNDTMGRPVGDDLLIQMARRLTECVGGRHLVVRLGGDEFAIFCEETTMDEAQMLVQAIVENLQHPFLLDGKPFRCATSVGVAPASGAGLASISDILHAADSAMYAAKQRGGNQYAVFENPLQATLIRQMQLEQDLFHAVERHEMRVHFQAQISVDHYRLIGFEALLRWTHPAYGPISPSEFIPMAEHTGQIHAIGSWVLCESLRQIGIWRERYVPELFVAVNVSVKQIATNDFAERVQEALEQTGTPSEALHLEVTESLLMEPSAESQLQAIQSLGVKIAIDDFGTGYSSLSYLQRLAVSGLKLDRTFLEDVGKDERKTALFGGIVRLAHTLGLTVVAEGIEEEAQLDCIRACDCDCAQGYLLSRPISAEVVESLFTGEWRAGLLQALPV